jgi:hypothetical protein
VSAVNLNDTPLYLHEWAELDHITALERHAALKLTRADLDTAAAERAAAQRDVTELVAASIAARLTHAPKRTPWHRLTRAVRVAWLRWEINSTEQWMRYAERDGVLDSMSLRYMQRQLEVMRVRLAIARAS